MEYLPPCVIAREFPSTAISTKSSATGAAGKLSAERPASGDRAVSHPGPAFGARLERLRKRRDGQLRISQAPGGGWRRERIKVLYRLTFVVGVPRPILPALRLLWPSTACAVPSGHTKTVSSVPKGQLYRSPGSRTPTRPKSQRDGPNLRHSHPSLFRRCGHTGWLIDVQRRSPMEQISPEQDKRSIPRSSPPQRRYSTAGREKGSGERGAEKEEQKTSAECRTRSAECRVQSAECRREDECRVQNKECRV